MGLNSPGVPGAQLPAGEDFMQRQIRDIQRVLRELVAATAVRPGSLGNAALTSPVLFDSTTIQQSGWAPSTTKTDFAAGTLAVPVGYWHALVMLTATASAKNTTAAAGSFYLEAVINGISSFGCEMVAEAPVNGTVSLASATATQVPISSDPPTIDVAARIRASATWGTSTTATVSAIAVFIRA